MSKCKDRHNQKENIVDNDENASQVVEKVYSVFGSHTAAANNFQYN